MLPQLLAWLHMTPLEVISALVSLLGIWLTMRRLLVAWPVIILSCLLYGEFFREIHLYSDMLLQGVFALCSVYGWWHWYRGVQDEGAVTVLKLNRNGWLIGILAGILGSLALGAFMARYTDASLPWLDASLTSFSLVGQWWQARKYLENWHVWVAVDLIYIGEYLWKQVPITAALYAIFVVMAVFGLRDWQRARAAQVRAA